MPSCLVLKCDDEKSYYNETISSQEKKIGSRILREKGLDYVFQPKKNSNGIGSWVEMGKVAKEEEEGIEEVFKYLLLYNTTSAHIVAESSKKV